MHVPAGASLQREGVSSQPQPYALKRQLGGECSCLHAQTATHERLTTVSLAKISKNASNALWQENPSQQ